MMRLAGVRGAVTVENDQAGQVLEAVEELLTGILQANPAMQPADLASVFFTVTGDISSVFPARAARMLGWLDVPLMCSVEIPVPGSLPLCIRVLMHWNTELPQTEIRHVYLRNAASLRPDLAAKYSNPSQTNSSQIEVTL
jgi:chorismate mutase